MLSVWGAPHRASLCLSSVQRDELGSPKPDGAVVARWCSTMLAQENPLQSLEKAWCPGHPLSTTSESPGRGPGTGISQSFPGSSAARPRLRLHQEGSWEGPLRNTSPLASGRDPEPSGLVPRARVSHWPSGACVGKERIIPGPCSSLQVYYSSQL